MEITFDPLQFRPLSSYAGGGAPSWSLIGVSLRSYSFIMKPNTYTAVWLGYRQAESIW
jgi:hypothetical protein